MTERSEGGVALITGLVGSGTMVVIGILVMFLWSFWLGLILALIGVVGAGALCELSGHRPDRTAPVLLTRRGYADGSKCPPGYGARSSCSRRASRISSSLAAS